jgi:chloride channel 3/4/5
MDFWHDGLCPTLVVEQLLKFIPQVPAGIFLPTIGIGACLGRAMGLIM